MKETANFGLKKPEENEFYDVNVQNDNMDAIDSVLQEFKDGTQQVGDSAKLGGKDASEYVTGVAELRTSILEKALTLSKGVYNYHFESTPSDLPVDSYKYGSATIFVRKENAILVVLWGINVTSTPIATNFYNGTAWSGWSKYATLTDLANYLPLSGGTIGYLYVKGANNGTFHILKNHTDSVDNGTLLSDINKNNEKTSINISANNDAAYLRKKDNSIKELLHTGNKPSGSYTGNGSATSRTINVGGVSKVLMIQNSINGNAFVDEYGALLLPLVGDIQRLSRGECNFKNGVLTMATENVVVNRNGSEFDYHSL